ncbi:EAL domain-containing protein [Rhodoferax sp. UBA5149]|uniref:EAL domain-containing protein n=1 Tax=Rhodoferax sp. UBA5149 TaxID=1947379 RepID=UPI0025CCC9F3|nr:EAL domain-containing protein [Rhodoferax sp. UBA5149]
MTSTFLPRHSLKTRITLTTLAIFLLGFWSLSYYASQMLRKDMQRLLGEQQFSTVSILAAEINQALDDRMRALEKMAGTAAPAILGNTTALQTFLEVRPVLQGLFNAGVIAYRLDGTVLAEVPFSVRRTGVNDRDTDAVAAALKEGKSTINRPVMGDKLHEAVFSMTVPIRDAQGTVVGALAGVNDLGKPNFLDRIAGGIYGKTGGYVLVATQYRLIVSATDKSRAMEMLPAPGINPLLDRYVQGYEGSSVLVNPVGVEVLASGKRVPVAAWFLAAVLPTAEAFAPIRAMQQRMLLATISLTLLAGGLIWWMLRRQLAPMLAAARSLTILSDTQQPSQPLPIDRQDEIGQLIGGFNRLLETLGQREALLKQILDTSSVAIFMVDKAGRITQANRRMAEMFGWSLDALEGLEYVALVHPSERELGRQEMLALLASAIESVDLERLYWRADHTEFWGHLTGQRFIDASGEERGLVGVIADITDHKQAEKYEQFRSRILELLVGGEALPGILEAIVLGVEQLHPATLCSILVLDSEGRHLRLGAAPSLPDFYNAAIDGVEIGLGVGSCGTAAFTGERVIVDDITTHPYWAPYKELAASAGLGACWSQPIRATSGQVIGTFAIYHREVHTPGPSDLATIEQSAHLASIAIERSVAEKKLRDSEAHYRLLTEDVSDVVWKQDSNHRFTYISPADERLRGYRADELIGHHVSEQFTADGVVALTEKLRQRQDAEQRGLKTGTATFEGQQRCKDGRQIWTEILSTPERDAHGTITGYHGISRDITARKQADAALRIAATAFESQEGIFVTDAARVILKVNQAFTEITGYTAQEAVGHNPRLFSAGRHDAAFYAAMTHSIERSGMWRGEIWNRRKNGEVYPEWLTITAVKDDTGLTTHYVATFSDITSSKTAEDEIKNLAFFDPLTHLPNRRLLMDRLEQAMAAGARHQRKGALLFVDLDDFKTLNDTLGHDKGDLLLQQVAKRLSTCIREGDTVARLGGDEFVVMLEDLSENALDAATQAEAVGEKILVALNQTYQLASYAHHSTPSIGVTLFADHQESIDEPMKRADLAMYQAKAAGRNTLRFFDPQMQAVVTARAVLETGLREAVLKNQFLLHYQAQVTGEHQLTGVEALVRWQHPQRGIVSPAEFIPLAEETGLILPLGRWVLEAACAQLTLWAVRADMAHLTVAVNVSARQFHQRDFVDQVLAVLALTGANPYRLKLELTESLLVSNVEDVIAKMNALKEKGVGFSLDDFGTGYSSLSYLKRLPLDQLKIDQGFVRDILVDPNEAAIAKMVVALADSLGLAVIAEGVETEAQRNFLAGQGCHAYQGYVFSRPLPLQEFEALVMRT